MTTAPKKPRYEMSRSELAASLVGVKIHHGVCVYPNDAYIKQNAIPADELQEHIDYNKTNRPGRGLFIDGVCVHRGGLTEEQVVKWEEKSKTLTCPPVVYPRQ